MAMTRVQLVADLWGMLQRQFTEAGITNADTSGNLKEPVDLTLLALGTDYGVLATGSVESSEASKALVLARYYGLSAVYDSAMNRVDSSKSVGAPSVQRSDSDSQYVRALETALAAARVNAAPFLPTENIDQWAVGRISLDFIEPGCEAVL